MNRNVCTVSAENKRQFLLFSARNNRLDHCNELSSNVIDYSPYRTVRRERQLLFYFNLTFYWLIFFQLVRPVAVFFLTRKLAFAFCSKIIFFPTIWYFRFYGWRDWIPQIKKINFCFWKVIIPKMWWMKLLHLQDICEESFDFGWILIVSTFAIITIS